MQQYFEHQNKIDIIKNKQTDLHSIIIKINKREFKKLIKHDFCTPEYYFDKTKDKKTITLAKVAIFVGIIGIVVMVILYLLSRQGNIQ